MKTKKLTLKNAGNYSIVFPNKNLVLEIQLSDDDIRIESGYKNDNEEIKGFPMEGQKILVSGDGRVFILGVRLKLMHKFEVQEKKQ